MSLLLPLTWRRLAVLSSYGGDQGSTIGDDVNGAHLVPLPSPDYINPALGPTLLPVPARYARAKVKHSGPVNRADQRFGSHLILNEKG